MITTDDKVTELQDRTYHALPESIRGTWSLGDDSDPWGDAMSHAFALNDLACLLGLPTDPTYSPGCGLSWDDTDSWPDEMYRDDYRAGLITDDDITTAIPVFATLIHALDLLGLSY
jgi:hypothetical protein